MKLAFSLIAIVCFALVISGCTRRATTPQPIFIVGDVIENAERKITIIRATDKFDDEGWGREYLAKITGPSDSEVSGFANERWLETEAEHGTLNGRRYVPTWERNRAMLQVGGPL